MHRLATDRNELLRLASQTLHHLETGAFHAALAEAAARGATENADSPDANSAGEVTRAVQSALDWAQIETELTRAKGELEGVNPAEVPYIPSNQVLSLLQSAYEEYVDEHGHPPPTHSELEIPFDQADPAWVSVAWEKLKGLFNKADFVKHTSLDDFRLDLPETATVALFSDWGTGEETAKRVMQQIKAANPTHAIHLGDVYYSGTEKEVRNRFLKVIDDHGPSMDSCAYFALNANHEMYSGGKGYFETLLKERLPHQKASYFNLRNQHWQLVGLDSAFEDHGLKDPQRQWLEHQLKQSGGARSILLSHHQLFSPYEGRAKDRKLFRKTSDLLTKVFAWFWGHEHKMIVYGDHLGIKARCIGHGAIPAGVPYDTPDGSVPIVHVDEREAPDGRAIHGFALLRFDKTRLDVFYIDEFGTEVFRERLDLPSPAFVPGPRRESVSAESMDPVAHFERVLGGRQSTNEMAMESLNSGGLDLTRGAIKERVDHTRAELHEIVRNYLGDDSFLHELADELANKGDNSLRAISPHTAESLDDEDEILSGLEVIVRMDGSRPSFLVRDGEVDTKTSPVGMWGDVIAGSATQLQEALTCVGRIDMPGSAQGFQGTGFLVAKNLIVTNRHVLQAVARQDAATREWKFRPGVVIDFGHEFRARNSVNPRALKRVVFSPPKAITDPIQHTKLDLVLVELERASDGAEPGTVLSLDAAPDWAAPPQIVYIAGYPGNPGLQEPLSLLEQLFLSTFGHKRIAPGEVMTATSAIEQWTFAHDASTLGGNSGSVVLAAGREGVAAGLHYGGTRANPRENWGHILGRTLDATDTLSGKTLRECLTEFGAKLVDRIPA